jgi:amino acid transporter
VVTIDTIGAVASNGAEGFTWLIFLGIFFFLPYALSIAELGSAFPQEGGPYVWTRLAFGRPLAAVNSVIYWISNPLWVGGSLTIVSFAAIETFFGPVGSGWKYVYAVVFIWFTIGAGLEVPSAAAEEMTNPKRDVPFAAFSSGIATMLAYGIPILSILIVLPASAVSGLTRVPGRHQDRIHRLRRSCLR